MKLKLKSGRSLMPNHCIEIYYSVSARCLLRKETTVCLPYQLDALVSWLQHEMLDKSHFELKWREFFKTYDVPANARLECRGPSIETIDTLDILMPVPCIEELSLPENPPVLTKIIQFYHDGDSFATSNNIPAIVTYYYGKMVLCSFDVYYELVQSLDEVEEFAKRYHACQCEREDLMDYWLKGGDIYSNPEGLRDYSDDPYDYIDYLCTDMRSNVNYGSMGVMVIPGNANSKPSCIFVFDGNDYYDDDYDCDDDCYNCYDGYDDCGNTDGGYDDDDNDDGYDDYDDILPF